MEGWQAEAGCSGRSDLRYFGSAAGAGSAATVMIFGSHQGELKPNSAPGKSNRSYRSNRSNRSNRTTWAGLQVR